MTTKFKKFNELYKKEIEAVTFGSMLRNLRLTSELTQVEMAKKLAISKQELCDIEKGRKFVSLERAIKFAKKLKHSEKFFLQLVIDDQVKKTGIKFKVTIEDAA